ncbi:ABC transporter substrate-binding protein [Ensifer adhaerens]|uniref:ABC transporter substrate-binding protein n=1 Tax=Ensifer adhaerens TaxID=106592 RepID=UPI001CBDD98F|nr:ABC transporter substrate-binding protein [Ensifer adhaerens]MBZ7924322.1 ABC transporter substrate-binding protein [Ensifer adhaerens]UAX96428.1 ABC transporter substrate-binding protein [Ensifer adhaerens]UAY04229.1 ABC transporter substrate-binding protein [Ensifer adhaerens]UAY12215.1 ABC transporter substrate-binding protein [Ensifer adhaerens]
MKRLLSNLLVAATIALGAAAARAEEAPTTIRFGDVGFGFGAPFGVGLQAIADAKGFIADEFKGTPTKVEFTYFTGTGPAINEALSNNQLDFASYGAVPNIIGKANGLDTVILASYGGTTIFGAARPDLDIKSIADLKGKKVAIQKATIIHWGLITALKNAGLSEKDITIVDLKNADQLAAIAAKSVDAVFGADFLLPLEDKGVAKIFYKSSDAGASGDGFGAFLVTDRFRKEYPEATQKVVTGFVKAAQWVADDKNRDEAFKIWSRAGSPVEVISKSNAGSSLGPKYNPRLDDFFVSRYQSGIAFDREQKLIRRDVDLDGWVDRSYVDNAVKSLNLQALWPDRSATGALQN